jgi:hypothetical protein
MHMASHVSANHLQYWLCTNTRSLSACISLSRARAHGVAQMKLQPMAVHACRASGRGSKSQGECHILHNTLCASAQCQCSR